MTVRLSRRTAVALLTSAALSPLATRGACAAMGDPAGRLIVLADLHSAYDRTATLLAMIEAEVAANPVPHLILINGDAFELGNVVAVRSAGAIDWVFLQALSRLAPTVLNIGNHEPDLDPDLSAVIARAQGIGITVVTTIADSRTGRPYAPPVADLQLGAVPVRIVGIATNGLDTYPKTTRPTLSIPEPASWASDNLGPLLTAVDALPVILSHAGVVADRAILPLLPDGSLLIGGHDHLTFSHDQGRSRYLHTGSWSAAYTVVAVGADRALTPTLVPVDPGVPPNAALAALTRDTLATHLTAEETATVGTATAMTLGETGRFIARTMAKAAGADIGFIGHTTLGAGLPEGAVSRYAFDAVVRFDGKLMLAEVDTDTLAAILAVVNQDAAESLDRRTGDFLYAAPVDLPAKPLYRIVTGDWPAKNQAMYFGRDDLTFAPGPDTGLKALVIAALN